ncbi:MAG: hypothetical protein MUE82_06790, partial [Chloroflexi bacterium]|nr:hypothetical protein [Chloroflexota bacterium]
MVLEAARAALARRRRLADGLPLERALYTFVAGMLREQLTLLADRLDADPVNPATPGAEVAIAEHFDRVADETRDRFMDGMAEAQMAGMAWGWQRFRESLPEMPASEAAQTYRPPPAPWKSPADIEHEYQYRGGAAKRVASLRDTPFALANPAAEGAARRHAATLVKGIDSTTRDTMRYIIGATRAQGVSSERLADSIRKAGFPTSYLPFDTPSPLRHIRDRAHLIAVT